MEPFQVIPQKGVEGRPQETVPYLKVAFPNGHTQRHQVGLHQLQLWMHVKRLPVMHLELALGSASFADGMLLEVRIPDPRPLRGTLLGLLTLP